MYITEVIYIKVSFLSKNYSCMFNLQKVGKIIKKSHCLKRSFANSHPFPRLESQKHL